MKTSTRVWWLADLPLLLLIVTIPLLTGRAIGFFMDSSSKMVDIRITLAFFVAYAGFEGAFLAWMTRCTPKPVLSNTARAFALRIQLQVAMQLVTRGAVILFVVFAFDELTSTPEPRAAGLPAQFYWPVFHF